MNVAPVPVLVESRSRTGLHRLNHTLQGEDQGIRTCSVEKRARRVRRLVKSKDLGLDSPGFSLASVTYQQNHVWEAFGTGHVASFCR